MDIGKTLTPDTMLTSYEVGALLQVNPSSVNKWSKEGAIIACRTPGGHRRFRASDIVEFVKVSGMAAPGQLEDLINNTAQIDAICRT